MKLLQQAIIASLLLLFPMLVSAIEYTALPLEHGPTGVLFRVQSDEAREIYVAGTFNGWAGSDGFTVRDERHKMYGPNADGIFEKFYPLTPGNHVFKYCIDGYFWAPGPPDLPRAKDDFDLLEGQQGMMGTQFEFSLESPPWPSYVSTQDMMPVAVLHRETNRPYLRVRFFSRQANTVHVVGSWDGWGGIAYRAVEDESHKMREANEPNFFESYIGPLEPGILEYKFVVNNRQWLSDPSVVEQSEDGNTAMQIAQYNGNWVALYTPRFDPDAKRRDTKSRWGDQLIWLDDRDEGFFRARASQNPMLWVITLPESRPSVSLMEKINADPEMVSMLKNMVCLETAAHEVEDILRDQRIFRLPHVVLVDSQYRPVYSEFNPQPDQLKAKLQGLN